MPTKFARLRKEALESCKFRGHKMRHSHDELRGMISGRLKHTGTWECTNCKAWMMISTHPYANECEISGYALAVTCGDEPFTGEV